MTECPVHGLQLKGQQRLVEIGHAAPAQVITECVPGLLVAGTQLAPIEQDVALVGVQLHGQALLCQLHRAPQIVQPAHAVAEGDDHGRIRIQQQSLAQAALAELAAGALVGKGRGPVHGAARVPVVIVVEHQRALFSSAVGIGENVLVHRTIFTEKVIQQEVGALRKQITLVQQRRQLALVALHQPVVGIFLMARPAVLHAVLFGEALDLSMTKHRQARQGGHDGRNTKALVAGAELIHRRTLVRVAHEVDVAFQNVRVELDGVLDHRAVLGVLLVAHHIHEGRVVNAMHAESADEVALHQPEGLGQQQRAGNLGGDAIHHLAPELLRHDLTELLRGHAEFGARRDGSAAAGVGKPEPLEVALCQGHGGVKANDREETRHVQDGLDDLLAHRRIQVVELRRVVPREAGAVVAVIDVTQVSGAAVAALKDHGRVRLVVVVALDANLDVRIGGKVRATEIVSRVRLVRTRNEPVGMLGHPGRVNAHVVGHHVTGQADAAMEAAVTQAYVCFFATQVVGNAVVKERIGAGHGVVIAAELLDGLRGAAALPDADQPQRVHAAAGQVVELFIRHLVELVNVPRVFTGELRQPHVGALGDKHRGRHPGLVGAKALVLVRGITEDGNIGVRGHSRPLLGSLLAAAACGFLGGAGGFGAGCGLALGVRGMKAHPDGQLFFAQDVSGDEQVAVEIAAKKGLPAGADEGELLTERARSGLGRRAQQVVQIDRRGALDRNQRAGGKIRRQLQGNLAISRLRGQLAVLK